MNAMLKPEFPITYAHFISACQSPTNKAIIRFQYERMQTSFSDMERSGETGNTSANYDRINLGGGHLFHKGEKTNSEKSPSLEN
jgi:hypothetical protein